MIQRHLPAIGPDLLTSFEGARPTNWLDPALKGRGGHDPNALISYWHWKDSDARLPDDIYRFGDSGGYQVATLGATIDPREVIRWQLKRTDVGCILDVPPYFTQSSTLHSGAWEGHAADNWPAALDETERNVRLALPMYTRARERDTSFRWWGVVHGELERQMEEWYRRVADLYPFDGEGEGWAFKPNPINKPWAIARCLRFAASKGLTRIHLLGGTGLPGLTTLFCLGRKIGLEFVSHDSSSSIKRGARRAVLVPAEDGLDWEERTENYRDRGESHARDYLRNTCDCGSCGAFRQDLDEDPRWYDDDRYVQARMVFHNHLITVRVLDALDREAARDPDGFLRDRLGRNAWRDAVKALEGRLGSSAPVGTRRSLFSLLDRGDGDAG